MFRIVSGLVTAAFTIVIATAGAQAGNAKTIRIEPRAFYGATVSLEAGVRVFRPLPPTTHMIINPNQTPINLTIKEETKTVNRTINHNVQNSYAPSGGYSLGGFSGFGGKLRGGKHHRGGHDQGNRGRQNSAF